MNDEVTRVLTMVQDGKVDAKTGAQLIEALKEQNTTTSYDQKILKVRVHSADNDHVAINLPIKVVKVLLATGHSVATNVPQAAEYLQNVDITMLIEAIEHELVGPIVDVQAANGDTVSIVID